MSLGTTSNFSLVRAGRTLAIAIFLLTCTSSATYSQIINIESLRLRGDTSKFLGNASGSFFLNKSSKKIVQLGFSTNLEYNTDKHTVFLICNLNWVKTVVDTVKDNFLNDGFFHVRYNLEIVESLKLEIFSQVQYNRMINLRQRELYGAGLRFKFLNRENVKGYIGTSLMWENAELVSESGEAHRSFNSSNYVSLTALLASNIKVVSTTYFQNNFDTGGAKVHAVLESSINIYKKIYYSIGFTVDYDSKYIYGTFNKLIYSTVNKVGVSF